MFFEIGVALLFDIFKAADADESGSLDKAEFEQALADSDFNLSQEALEK